MKSKFFYNKFKWFDRYGLLIHVVFVILLRTAALFIQETSPSSAIGRFTPKKLCFIQYQTCN